MVHFCIMWSFSFDVLHLNLKTGLRYICKPHVDFKHSILFCSWATHEVWTRNGSPPCSTCCNSRSPGRLEKSSRTTRQTWTRFVENDPRPTAVGLHSAHRVEASTRPNWLEGLRVDSNAPLGSMLQMMMRTRTKQPDRQRDRQTDGCNAYCPLWKVSE